jgi:hypothetical protein
MNDNSAFRRVLVTALLSGIAASALSLIDPTAGDALRHLTSSWLALVDTTPATTTEPADSTVQNERRDPK